MMIVMMIEAVYEIISAGDSRHLFFLEDGHDDNEEDV